MNPAFIPFVKKAFDAILDRIPNPAERERAQREFDAALLQAEQAAMQGQLEVNKIEAGHRSMFVAGWRPFIGWVGGFAIAYMFLIKPMAAGLLAIFGSPVVMPEMVDPQMLFELVLALLGIGGMRTFEKFKGVNHR